MTECVRLQRLTASASRRPGGPSGPRAIRAGLVALVCSICIPGMMPAAQVPPEEIARRQYESGLAFVKQGNYAEALKDFQAVVELHPTSSVADNAWLQIGLHYLDRLGDVARAEAAADIILKKYPTTDAAAEAQVLAGRALLAKSRRPSDLSSVVANFDRVPRLFPDSAAVPQAFVYAGDALRLLDRHRESLVRYQRVLLDYPNDAQAPAAHLGFGMALAATGDPVSAMEAFQRVRNRWPDSRDAALALKRQTILYRLIVRKQGGSPFSLAGDLPKAGTKLPDVRDLVMTPDDALYFASDEGIAVLLGPAEARAPGSTRPRALTLDVSGDVVVVEEAALRPRRGNPVTLAVTRPGQESPRRLEHLEAAVALPTGEWLVADGGENAVHRFTAGGEYAGTFASVKALRLAVGPFGEVAALERDSRTVLVFSGEGKPVGKVLPKGTGHTLRNPRDVAYDVFGHLYVLDEAAVVIFDRQLQLVQAFAEAQQSPGAFRDAVALAVDSAGRLYVADKDLRRVRIYQ